MWCKPSTFLSTIKKNITVCSTIQLAILAVFSFSVTSCLVKQISGFISLIYLVKSPQKTSKEVAKLRKQMYALSTDQPDLFLLVQPVRSKAETLVFI